MRNMSLGATVVGLGLAWGTAAANAQINAVGPFTGAWQEGWEGGLPGGFLPCHTGIFGGNADVCWNPPGLGQGMHVTTGWFCSCGIPPHSGGFLFGGAGSNPEFTFASPISRFGAYFGDICMQGSATAEFYDSNGGLIASAPITVNACTWVWNGWESTGPAIKSVRIISNTFGGGLIQMDDCEADPAAVGCYPDCNESGSLTVADFTCFQGEFLNQTAYGDCNNSGTWTVADFTCFQVEYLNGCP